MRRNRISLAVLALALLVAMAFLLRREPVEQKPPRHEPRREAVAAPAAPAPVPVSPAPEPASAVPPPPAPVFRGPPGTVRGSVKIAGPVPPRKVIKLDVDPKCQSYHAGVVLSDQLVADAGGNVQWVFVQ